MLAKKSLKHSRFRSPRKIQSLATMRFNPLPANRVASNLAAARCGHRRWVCIPTAATVPQPLLQLSPALVTSPSGALSSLLRETGASDATNLWFVAVCRTHLPLRAPKQVLLAQLSLLWRELPLLHASWSSRCRRHTEKSPISSNFELINASLP
jgi:hypothetical protein